MNTNSWTRWITAAVAMVLVFGLTVVGGAPARAQQATPVVTLGDELPVAIHEGTCAAPVAEPVFDLGNAVPFGTADDDDDEDDDDDVRGTVPTDPVLATEETIDTTFDDLFDTQHVIAVHASPEAFGTIVACGELGGVEEDGRVVVALRPVGGSDLAGVATFDEDEEGILGIGEDEVRITANLIPNVSGTAGAAPAATPVATGGNTVDVTLTEFAIDAPTTVAAGAVTFVVTNAGAIEHNFEIEGQGIEEEFAEDLQPGETGELTLTLEPGAYEVYCPVGNHAEQGMEIELTVTG
ncbi:MAG: cupredoxin domain-containing protein [Thermomicrobiales bacterium]